MKWSSQEFAQLQREWYERLREAGFIDIETLVGGEPRLTQAADHVYRHHQDETARAGKQLYFEMLAKFASDEEFDDEAEKIVMIRRAEGIPIKLICVELQERRLKCHRLTVRRIIHRYENQWGIRVRKPRSA